jgi:hypothetical protein
VRTDVIGSCVARTVAVARPGFVPFSTCAAVSAFARRGMVISAPLPRHASLSELIQQGEMFAGRLRRRTELYQFDLRVVACGCGQSFVARQQRRVERLR